MKIKFCSRLVYFSALSLIVSCASSEKQSSSELDDGLTPPAMNKSASVPLPENVKGDSQAEGGKRPAISASSALDKAQANLQDAIKAQSDESIYRASTQVLSLNPQDIKALNSLGLYNYKKNKLVAAQYFFGKAIQANANVSEVHNNIGLVHLAQKETRDAIKDFRKALEIDSNNASAAANLGAIYIEQKDYTKALMAMEIAVKRGKADYKNLVNYGVALAGIGQGSQAKEQYEQAIKLNSTGREAIYNLAVLNIDQLKQYQQGLDLLSKLRFMGSPDSSRMKINALENRAKAGLQ